MSTVEHPAAPGDARAQRRFTRRLALLVFTVGVSTLGAEIAAARLMAPFFGASTIVWANTIAVVLVALSIGYWIGGRIADRRPSEEALRRWVLAGAGMLALVPLVARPFLDVSTEALDAIDAGAFVGSLIGVLALVAVPLVVLGAVAPWAIRLSVERVEDAGTAAGRLYAISTVGSLLGTFLAALLLIPLVGTQRTFIGFALALAVVAAPGLPRRFLLAPAIIAALLAVPPGTTKDADAGVVVEERETAHQYVRVVQRPSGTLRLELNEGQGVHSLRRPGTVLTDGVWDGYLVLPHSVLGRAPRSIAILGNGAGTTARAYGELFPETEIDGVEIDGELHEIGRRWFGLEDRPGLRLHTADARPFLRRAERRWEAIFVDAYRQPYIPFYLTTIEFFRLARERLAPGGVVIVNAGHPERNTALEEVLAAGLREVFGHVRRDPIRPRNTLLVASDRRPTADRMLAAAPQVPPPVRPVLRASAARLGPALGDRDAYRDDRAPVEWLIDKSILEYAGEEG